MASFSVSMSYYYYCRYLISERRREESHQAHLAAVLIPAVPCACFLPSLQGCAGTLPSSFIHSKLAIIVRISLMSLNIVLASTGL